MPSFARPLSHLNAPQYGVTPLHYASKEGHTGAMELLLQAGADINAYNHVLWLTLHA